MCMNMRMCMNMHIWQCEETWICWLDMRVKMRISDEYAMFPGNMRGNRGTNMHEYVCLVYTLHIQCTDIGESCVPHITTILCGVSCCALLHMFIYTTFRWDTSPASSAYRDSQNLYKLFSSIRYCILYNIHFFGSKSWPFFKSTEVNEYWFVDLLPHV